VGNTGSPPTPKTPSGFKPVAVPAAGGSPVVGNRNGRGRASPLAPSCACCFAIVASSCCVSAVLAIIGGFRPWRASGVAPAGRRGSGSRDSGVTSGFD